MNCLRRRLTLTLTRLALALLPLLHAGQAQTATVTWVGPSPGDWSQFQNWSTGARPTAADDVQLGVAFTQISNDFSVANVLSSGRTRFSNGRLSVSGVADFAEVEVRGGAGLQGAGTTRVRGLFDLTGSGLAMGTGHTLIAEGSTAQTGRDVSFGQDAQVINRGTWRVTDGPGDSVLYLQRGSTSATFDNAGRFEVADLTEVDVATRFLNSGTIAVARGSLNIRTDFNNQGLITLAGGTFGVQDASHPAFINSGTLSGSGSTGSQSGLVNAGSLIAGGAGVVGALQVFGDLRQTGSGQVQIDLARSNADRLQVLGSATLGGALSLNVVNGQRLARNSAFTVMTWGSRANNSQFDTLDFAQASGYRFTTTYNATGLEVTVTAVPYTWTGAATGGFWDKTQNWNDGTDGLPQAGDTVLLGGADTRIRSVVSAGDVSGTGSLSVEGGGHLVLGGTGSVGGLQMRSGSQLTNTGRLVATGDSSWVGSVLRGPGVTRIEGAFAIAGNDFDSSPGLLNNHTLELAGTTTYTGRRGLSVGDGATLVNQGTWVDQAPTNVTLGNFNGGTSRFLNQGTFTKASNTNTLIGEGTSMVFESTGTINVDAGYLRLSSSRVSSTGALNIAKGAELSLVSFDATLGGSVFNEGTLSLDGGVLTIAGDLLVQSNGLTRVKSTVNNNSVLRITGTVDWVESTLRGTGSTRMEGPVLLTGDRSRGVLGGQTVELAGTTTQVGTGGLSIGQGARLRNLGTWLDAAPGNVGIGNFNGGATPHFENVGSFTKTSAFVTEIGNGLNFINTGTLDIQAGTLRISDNATLTAGQVQIARGATLDLSSGSIALKGTVQNAGTLALTGATVLVTDSATVKGGLTTFKGVMANTGQLRIAGSVDWFEGDLRGSGTTRIDGALALRGGASRQLRNGQTLELAGTTTQIDASNLLMANGARLVNRGHWVDAANGNVFLGTNFGDTNRFDNIGQFTKTSVFVTTIGNGLVFNNTGTLDLQAGTLSFSESFNNQGLLRLAAGAELASSVANLANAGTLAGDGTVRTAASFFSLNNTGTLAAGGLGDTGTLSLVGGLTQQASGTFLVDLGSTAAGGFDVLTVSGSASLGGTLAVNLLAGAHFNVGDSFTVMTWTQRLGNSQFASLDLTRAGGYGFEADYGATNLTLRVMTAPVPEPESWALMAAGLAGLGALQRRRRTRAST